MNLWNRRHTFFCLLSVLTMDFISLSMDPPSMDRPGKPAVIINRGSLSSYPMIQNMTCVASIREKIIIGGPQKSYIFNPANKRIREILLPAMQIASYPDQNLMVVTNPDKIEIYKLNKEGKELSLEYQRKSGQKLHSYVGKSFLMGDGKELVFCRYCATDGKSKIKICAWKNWKNNTIKVFKPEKDFEGIPLCVGSSSLSDDIFLYESNRNTCTIVQEKKVLGLLLFPVYSFKKIALRPQGPYIAALVDTRSSCCVFFDQKEIPIKPIWHHVPSPFEDYVTLTFYTGSIVALFVRKPSGFADPARTLTVEYYDIDKKEIIFTALLQDRSIYEIANAHDSRADIVFSPDYSKCIVLSNNALFISDVPLSLRMRNSDYKDMVALRSFLIRHLPLLPRELSSLIIRLLFFYL